MQMVGALGIFRTVIVLPLALEQMYLVTVGVVVAYIFTLIPEWTSWILLVLMALYDLAAVLLPFGPLRVRNTQI
jgi:presenilin 1